MVDYRNKATEERRKAWWDDEVGECEGDEGILEAGETGSL